MEIREIPEFINREKELKRVQALLSGRPNLIYFVYGPINSGKTALLTKVFEELPEDYVVFYFNFRGIYIENIGDLLQVLFEIKAGEQKTEIKEVLKEFLKEGAKKLKKTKGIPIPENIFDKIFNAKKLENIFKYLETVFEEIRGSERMPVFVLDELQTIKEMINTQGRPLIYELFNFMVRLTKETHLCHCLCATSDCLFIESIYSNARLEGRAKYVLIDDLSREEAFKIYEEFGFENRELVWKYIGGKIGDVISLYEEKKQGYTEEEALKRMLKNEIGRLEWMIDLIEEGLKQGPPVEEIRKILKKFKEKEKRKYKEMKGNVLKFLIEENILFYNPVEGTVRPQSRLIHRAIKELK